MIKALIRFTVMLGGFFLVIAIITALIEKFRQRRHLRRRLKSYLPGIEDIKP